jgi:hypothetical protein
MRVAPMNSNLNQRLAKLEAATAPPAAPKSFSGFWSALRLCYGDHLRYSAEELSQLDQIDPRPALYRMLDEVYGSRHEHQDTA